MPKKNQHCVAFVYGTEAEVQMMKILADDEGLSVSAYVRRQMRSDFKNKFPHHPLLYESNKTS